jgi:aldose 1-epimerase
MRTHGGVRDYRGRVTSPTTSSPATAASAPATPFLPSGTQHALRHGDQVAVIAAVGASLREYRVGDRDVVLPFDEHQIAPAFSGAVLAPWPNRLANGAYGYRGVAYQVSITEADRQTALHGLVAYVPFALESRDEASLTLTTTIVPTPD